MVEKMQYIDFNFWLIGDILLKADKMSMANSLELRVPFLDKEVFKVASQLPTNLRVNKHNTKYAMRQSALRHLPIETAEKKKLGFPVPTRVWLRDERYYNIVKEMFNSDIKTHLVIVKAKMTTPRLYPRKRKQFNTSITGFLQVTAMAL